MIPMKQIQGIIDFHSHVLPGADHGSSSLETTLFQIESAYKSGVRRIIATPHFYPHKHDINAFIERRNTSYEKLLPHLGGRVELRVGAEALICRGFENLPDMDRLFIYGTNSLLLELPSSDFDESYCYTVKALRAKGIDVIMAHADRYQAEIVERMVAAGVRIQLNASSLARICKRRAVLGWLDRGLVVALGSDIHERNKKAYPQLVRAFAAAGKARDGIIRESELVWNNSSPLM